MEPTVKDNLKAVLDSIAGICSKRDIPETPKLVAVTKGVPVEKIRQAYDAGIRLFGENYIQEALVKIEELSSLSDIQWHFIGSLQTNKVKKAVGKFALIQTVDRENLAFAINKEAEKLGIKNYPVLIEVNLAGESSKSGVNPDKLLELITKIHQLEGIKICGLMTIPPYSENGEDSRQYFPKLREFKNQIDSLKMDRVDIKELSMGMSSDYIAAIEEGSTMIRIGRAIFGRRG